MAKRARPLNARPKAPGAVESQRLQKIAETKRALRQERQLVALAKQLRGAIVRTSLTREQLLEVLAKECGWLVTKHAGEVPREG